MGADVSRSSDNKNILHRLSAGLADACVASQNKVDQSLVTYGMTGRKISNKPQPRKPSHAIIAIAIVATSRPMTIRRLNAPREEPDLIRGSLRSIGLRLFIGAVAV